MSALNLFDGYSRVGNQIYIEANLYSSEIIEKLKSVVNSFVDYRCVENPVNNLAGRKVIMIFPVQPYGAAFNSKKIREVHLGDYL